MGILDRATRTTEARIAWAALLVLFLIGLLWARSAQRGDVAAQVRSAEGRAIRYSDTTVSDQVIERGDRIAFASAPLKAALNASVMTDPTVVSLRVWSPEGELLASTVKGETRATHLEGEPRLADAVGGATESSVVNEPTGKDGATENVLKVFTPLQVGDRSEPVGVVEVDFHYQDIAAAAPKSSTWTRFFSLLALICAVMLGICLAIELRERKGSATPKLTHFTNDDPIQLRSVSNGSSGAKEPPRADELREELAVTREQLRQATEAVAFLEGRVREGAAPSALQADVESARSRIAELESELGHVRIEADQAKAHAVSTEQELDRLRTQTDEQVAVLQQRMREVANGAGNGNGNGAVDQPAASGNGNGVALEQQPTNGNGAEADEPVANGNGELLAAPSDPFAPAPRQQRSPEPPRQPEPIREVPSLIAELEAQVADAETEVGALRAEEPVWPNDQPGEGTDLKLSPEADALRARLAKTAARKKRLGSERPDVDPY